MRITDMRLETYRWPRTKPIRNGMYVYANAGLNVVRIETDEGVTGVGLAGGIEEAPEVAEAPAKKLAKAAKAEPSAEAEAEDEEIPDWKRKLMEITGEEGGE